MEFQLSPQNLPRVVIIGAGFGGLRAARRLKHSKVHITLIDKSNHHVFQPLLYQVATAGLSPADIASPVRSIVHDQPNTEVVLDEVIDINVADKKVVGKHDNYDFDFLIVATGARHGYFGHDDWEKFAPGLKSINDGTTIRRNILMAFEEAELEKDAERRQALLTFVIVGGGPTGCELAGAISELARKALVRDFRHIDPTSAKIILIEAGPRILNAFPESLSQRAAHALKKLGVEIRTSARVTQIDEKFVYFGEEKISSYTKLWAAGVVASPAAQWLKVQADKAGRVAVDDHLNLPDSPDIYVIGDTAHVEENGSMLPGVAPVAMQQGTYVGDVIRRRLRGETEIEPFRYRNKGNLATIGRSFAIADLGKMKLSGFIAWLAWLIVHIYYLIGFRNRILVMIQWAWAYLTFQRGARLIVAPSKEQREP